MIAEATNIRWCVYCGMDLFLSDRPRKGVCDICQGMNHHPFVPVREESDYDKAWKQLYELETHSLPSSWALFRSRIGILHFLMAEDSDVADFQDEIVAAKAAVDARHVRGLKKQIKRAEAVACPSWSRRLKRWQKQAKKLEEAHGNEAARWPALASGRGASEVLPTVRAAAEESAEPQGSAGTDVPEAGEC